MQRFVLQRSNDLFYICTCFQKQSDSLNFHTVPVADARLPRQYLNKFLTNNTSYHDQSHRAPEISYHQFVAGMACNLSESHESKSNLESGDGRADLSLCPRVEGQPGACLEFKVRKGNEDVDTLLDEALRQIDEKRYITWLKDRKADPIQKVAVVFEGKKARVKCVSAT